MKWVVRYWLLLGIGLTLLSGCEKPAERPSEGFSVQASLSTNALTVGDPVTLTLTARHPAGSTVHFPNIGKNKETVVQGRSSEERRIAAGILETEESIRLTSFRVGDWIILTNPATCTFSNGTAKTETFPEVLLHVHSTLSETNATQLSDIKDIVKPSLRISPKLWIPALIISLIIILILIVSRRRNKPRTILQTPDPEPPHIIARRALDALRSKPWSPEPFFTELSRILRTYLEDRFRINAPESTTEELTRSMSHDARLEIKEQQTLRNFLTQADLVKFARADAEGDVMRSAFATVEEFVEQTKEEPKEDVE